jgi:DNA polymerase III epsilon subunit-like protein
MVMSETTVPSEFLKHRTELKKLGLVPNGAPVTRLWTGFQHTEFFDVRDTKAAKRATPAQVKALEKARAVKLEKEEAREQEEQEAAHARMLEEEAELAAMIERDHAAMRKWAGSRVADPLSWVVLDTETTGLEPGCEIVQIAVVRGDGVVLLDTLVKPMQPIPDEVSQIHGITDADVQNAPSFLEVWSCVLEAIGTRDLLVYNASFDLMMMHSSLAHYGVRLELVTDGRERDVFTGDTVQRFVSGGRVECAMDRYAMFAGDWSRRRGEYRWVPLNGGHQALGDCRAVLHLMNHMATAESEVCNE